MKTFTKENESLFDNMSYKFADEELVNERTIELEKRQAQMNKFYEFKSNINTQLKVIKQAKDLIKARIWEELKKNDNYKIVFHDFHAYGISLDLKRFEEVLKEDYE